MDKFNNLPYLMPLVRREVEFRAVKCQEARELLWLAKIDSQAESKAQDLV